MPTERHLALEPGPGLLVSILVHFAAFAVVQLYIWIAPAPLPVPGPECGNGKIERDEACDDGNTRNGDGCSSECTLEIEVVEIEEEEEEPELDEPEPPPPDPPEPPPPPDDPPPPPPKKKKDEPEPPPEPQPPPDAPPPIGPIELPADTVIPGGNSGVVVRPSQGAVRPGTKGGKPGGNPKGKPGGTGTTVGGTGDTKASGPPWTPKGDLFIAQLPRTVRVDEVQCPAVSELGVSGSVILRVQVRKDGKIRRVKVAKGIGYGCDQIAAKALRKAKFKPAIGTDGKPADYELRYTYEFEATR